MWSALHLKEKVLWGRITWSGMGKQNTQARKVYSTVVPRAFTLGNEFSIGTAGKRNWFNSYAFVYFLSSLHKFSGPTILTGKDLGCMGDLVTAKIFFIGANYCDRFFR